MGLVSLYGLALLCEFDFPNRFTPISWCGLSFVLKTYFEWSGAYEKGQKERGT